MADEREKQYQDALKKLQSDNEAKSKKLDEQYQIQLTKINKQKLDMENQFNEFKKPCTIQVKRMMSNPIR